MAEHFKNLILDKNRINALKKAENNFDVAILDDGYQDLELKDLNILCFNSNQMLGNGLVSCRTFKESLNRIKDAHIIYY